MAALGQSMLGRVAFRETLSFDIHDLPSLLDWMQDSRLIASNEEPY